MATLTSCRLVRPARGQLAGGPALSGVSTTSWMPSTLSTSQTSYAVPAPKLPQIALRELHGTSLLREFSNLSRVQGSQPNTPSHAVAEARGSASPVKGLVQYPGLGSGNGLEGSGHGSLGRHSLDLSRVSGAPLAVDVRLSPLHPKLSARLSALAAGAGSLFAGMGRPCHHHQQEVPGGPSTPDLMAPTKSACLMSGICF